jgi:hypothetical protein
MVGMNRDCLKADFSFFEELPWLSRSRSGSLLPERVPGEVWLLELLMRKKFLILVGRWLDSLECFREGRARPGIPRFSLLFVTADDGLEAKSCVILGGSLILKSEPQ